MSKPVNWSHLPVAMPNGSLVPHLSARMRTEMMDAVFFGVGGFERLKSWVETSDDNYGTFFKAWSQGQAKATQVEHTASEGVEALLAKLDERERIEGAKIINGEYKDTEDADYSVVE